MLAVPQHHAAHIAHAIAVHEYLPRGDGAVDLGGVLGELHDLADVADEDMPGVHAHLAGQLGVGFEMALLPVDGNEEPGLDQGVDDFQLLLAGVARDVEGAAALVDDLGVLPVELVDDAADGVLVARDGRGRDDDPVPGANFHLPVGVEGHAGQGGHGLALTAGGDDAHLIVGQALDVVDIHQHPVGDAHITQFHRHLHSVLHAPAGDGDFPPVLGGHGDDLLNAVHIGGEGGDDDAALAPPEQGVEGGAHAALALGKAGALHIGGVAQQGQHALLSQLSQAGEVGHPTLDGGGVDLEIAGVNHRADGGLDGEGHRVGNGVVDMNELHAELAGLDHLARLAGDELGLVGEVVFLQLQAHQSRRHAGGVDGHVDAAQQVGDGPDVVLVAVGEKNTPDLVPVLDEVGKVGDDHVDSVHVVVGESHAHVHHDDIPAVLIDRQVFADLIEAAQRNNFQFFCHEKIKHSFYPQMNSQKTTKQWYVRTPGPSGPRNRPRSRTGNSASSRPCLAGKMGAYPSGPAGLHSGPALCSVPQHIKPKRTRRPQWARTPVPT